MIVDRSLVREITFTSTAVGVIIITIFVVVRLVRFLSEAAAGNIPVDSIFLLLGLKLASNLDVMLPMVFYVAILMVMSRWSRDHELIVLTASGIGLGRLLQPVMLMGVVLATALTVSSFYLTPMSVRYTDTITTENKNRVDIKGVVPGAFSETRGQDVYYVERMAENKELLINVFIYGEQPNKEGVVVAQTGHQYVDDLTGDRFLVLKNGTRYEGNPGQADYAILEFETYALRIKTRSHVQAVVTLKGVPTRELLNSTDPRLAAEFHWRLAKPVSIIILVLLAMSFTHYDVRRPQFYNTILAFGAYFLYANMLGYGNALLRKGKVDPELGLWWVHLIFVVLGAYIFSRRSRNKSLIPLPGR
ncbi:MAG: LPS export ABC transporter permease LptF [Gammaproteobacteria bacterium]|nr:LPS export ABC transporter permease LptF [Gammaproteobacteria bacterium]